MTIRQHRVFYLVAALVFAGFLAIGLMLALQATDRFMASFPTPDPRRSTAMLEKFFNASMKYSDVPGKYRYSGQTESIERDGGWGESRVQYANELAPTAHVYQEILIFPNREMAIRSIELQKSTDPDVQFSDVLSELDTIEKLVADRTWFGCSFPIRVQEGLRAAVGKYCVAISKYDTVVMELFLHCQPVLVRRHYPNGQLAFPTPLPPTPSREMDPHIWCVTTNEPVNIKQAHRSGHTFR